MKPLPLFITGYCESNCICRTRMLSTSPGLIIPSSVPSVSLEIIKRPQTVLTPAQLHSRCLLSTANDNCFHPLLYNISLNLLKTNYTLRSSIFTLRKFFLGVRTTIPDCSRLAGSYQASLRRGLARPLN